MSTSSFLLRSELLHFELIISQLFRKALVTSLWLFFISPGLTDSVHCISVPYGSCPHPHPPRCDVLMSNKTQTVNLRGSESSYNSGCLDIVVIDKRCIASTFLPGLIAMWASHNLWPLSQDWRTTLWSTGSYLGLHRRYSPWLSLSLVGRNRCFSCLSAISGLLCYFI